MNDTEYCHAHKDQEAESTLLWPSIGAILGAIVVPGVGGLIGGAATGLVARAFCKEYHKVSKRIFISFAIEDANYRDLLKGQALHTDTPFDYTDMSAKEAWDEKWKTNCRARIQGCDGVIALISKRTRNADGAKWEMQCANDEGISMIGVHIHKDDKGQVPAELAGRKVIEWTWDGIARFINSL
jgi:hypothetical protein